MPANVETMAYRFADRSDTPWHGLGMPVDRNEEVSSREFQKLAGAAWTVRKERLWVRANRDNGLSDHIQSDAYALMRDDNHLILNVVSNQYKVLQNIEVFDFFHDFCNAGNMDIETGGVLDEGRTVWCLASLREGFTLSAGDRVQGFLLFSNSHGGARGRIKFTGVRVVCANTLALAHQGVGQEFRIHHRTKFDPDTAKSALGLGHRALETFREQAEFLVSKTMDDAAYTRFIERLFPLRTVERSGGTPELIRPRNYTKAVSALAEQVGADMNRGTWWSGYNAITYMVDHMQNREDKSRTLNNAWFGSGDALKASALTTALEMAR